LDGTRTFLVGREQVAVIDPGPDVEHHLRALLSALEPAREIRILLTHRHSDHAGAAPQLVEQAGASLLAPASYPIPDEFDIPVQLLNEGDRVATDQGDLVVLEVPGHTKGHVAFHWMEANALFVGDLLLGKGNTTWIGEYLGCIQDYLDSLAKVEALGASVLYPGHGPPITSVGFTVERFRRHRLARVEEVRTARLDNPGAGAGELAEIIYGGEIPEKLAKAAESSVEATLFHLG